MFQVFQTRQPQQESLHPDVAPTDSPHQGAIAPGKAVVKVKHQRRFAANPQTRRSLLISGVFFLAALKISQVLISEALHFLSPVEPHQATPQVQLPQRSQAAQLQQQAESLFATPDSLGAIAVGVAEGTRTPDGSRTVHWESHIDPGNGKTNRGTFSWQQDVSSAAEADARALRWIRQDVIPRLLQEARREGVTLNVALLVQGIDLWTQAPKAGADFIKNLKRCQELGGYEGNALLCARVEGYVDPQTGQLQAKGLGNDFGRLVEDQSRRVAAVQRTLQLAERAQN